MSLWRYSNLCWWFSSENLKYEEGNRKRIKRHRVKLLDYFQDVNKGVTFLIFKVSIPKKYVKIWLVSY